MRVPRDRDLRTAPTHQMRAHVVLWLLCFIIPSVSLAQPASARICNEGDATLGVAVAWLQSGGGIVPLLEAKYKLHGWYQVFPGKCANVYQDTFARYFYLGFVQYDAAGALGAVQYRQGPWYTRISAVKHVNAAFCVHTSQGFEARGTEQLLRNCAQLNRERSSNEDIVLAPFSLLVTPRRGEDLTINIPTSRGAPLTLLRQATIPTTAPAKVFPPRAPTPNEPNTINGVLVDGSPVVGWWDGSAVINGVQWHTDSGEALPAEYQGDRIYFILQPEGVQPAVQNPDFESKLQALQGALPQAGCWFDSPSGRRLFPEAFAAASLKVFVTNISVSSSGILWWRDKSRSGQSVDLARLDLSRATFEQYFEEGTCFTLRVPCRDSVNCVRVGRDFRDSLTVILHDSTAAREFTMALRSLAPKISYLNYNFNAK